MKKPAELRASVGGSLSKFGSVLKTVPHWLRRRLVDAVVAEKPLPTPVTVYYMILVSTVVLVGFGFLMMFSTAPLLDLSRQVQGTSSIVRSSAIMLVGLLLLTGISLIPMGFWRKTAVFIFLLSLVFQSLILTPLAASEGGNTNWIYIPGFGSLQPSEFIKFSLPLFLAWMYSGPLYNRRDWKALSLCVGLPVAAAIFLVMLGSDLGTVLVLVALALGVVLVARIPWQYLGVVGIGALFLTVVAVVQKPSRFNRIISVLPGNRPETNLAAPEQIDHALWALGSGGLLGVGPGASKEKWDYLAAAHTDFIFAVLGEELGFLGAISVVIAFSCLIFGMNRLALLQEDLFSRLVVTGICAWLGAQVLINLGAVLSLTPIIGVPLPFISSGGSAFLATSACLGLILRVAKETSGAKSSFGFHGWFRNLLSA